MFETPGSRARNGIHSALTKPFLSAGGPSTLPRIILKVCNVLRALLPATSDIFIGSLPDIEDAVSAPVTEMQIWHDGRACDVVEKSCLRTSHGGQKIKIVLRLSLFFSHRVTKRQLGSKRDGSMSDDVSSPFCADSGGRPQGRHKQSG